MNKKSDLTMLGALVVLCLLVELIGGWFTQQTVHTWYPEIAKPSWTPPDLVFAPVWTILYMLMAVSVWLIWKTPTTKDKNIAYTVFGVQLFLNMIWSGLFFTLKNPLYGLVDLIPLWFLIIGMLVVFYRIKPLAAALLIPYFLWVSYALALNYSIWTLNP